MSAPGDINTSGYGRAFALWRKQAAGPWQAYTRHKFVEGLRDGSLPQEAFLHYLKQDYVFLIHYSRAWALAVAKSETLSEMKAASAVVHALLSEEIQLHVEVCRRLGISEEQLFATRERAENLAYTRYVLEAGYSGDLLDLLASLAPCALGYGEIGLRLGCEAPSDKYHEWIGVYAGAEYQAFCIEVGNLIDSALTHRLGAAFDAAPRWAALSQHFETATRLEAGFWDMGLSPS